MSVYARLAFGFVVLGISQFSYAYTWYMPYFQILMASPSALCNELGNRNSPKRTYGYVLNANGTSGNCTDKGSLISIAAFHRQGTSCPAGRTYNPSTGECLAPPGGQSCERDGTPNTGFGFVTNADGECVDWTRADLPSQCKSLAGTGAPKKLYVSFNSDGNPESPPPLNIGGCHAIPGPTGHCQKSPVKTYPTGGTFQSNIAECMVYVSFTGDVTSGGSFAPPVVAGPGEDGVCDPSADCADIPPAPVSNQQQPCTYVEDGEGRRVCTSHNYNYVPGASSCGTVNGEFKCIGKAPETNGITIGTTVEEKQNADGSTTTTKTDTIEQVKCVGANACTSTTTKNSTIVIKDGAGNTTSESGSCVGPLCAPDGKGDKDGDGIKDCIGPRCAEDGDEEEEFAGPENDEVGSFGETTAQFMDRVQGAPIVSAARGLSFSSGGSCSFETFTVPILGTLSFQPICGWAADWLGPLRAIMLAVWALVAVRTFFEA